MSIDVGLFAVEKLIVHEVPKRRISTPLTEFQLTEDVSPLTQDVTNYFQRKIAQSLNSSGLDVVFQDSSSSPVPDLVLDNLGTRTTSFVEMSQRLANHLYQIQTGVNPAGLLIAIQARLGKASAIALLKLERETGLEAHEETSDEGKRVFGMRQLNDLMLTQRTKVFKVAVFAQAPRKTDLASIIGRASDEQRSYNATAGVADFFLSAFLGCKPKESPELTTAKFFERSTEFINDDTKVPDPETKYRYQTALFATLNSNVTDISPNSFAEQNLAPDDRDQFIQYRKDAEIPVQAFAKDVARIEQQLKKRQVKFESGISVVGSPSAFDEHVLLKDVDQQIATVTIQDAIKTLK